MILTPFLSLMTSPLYAMRKKRFKSEPIQTMNIPKTGLHKHVVIAGVGKIGSYVAHVFRKLKIDFVLIEMDFHQVNRLKREELPMIYGDVSQPVLLKAARIAEASLLIITTPSVVMSQSIVENSRKINPKIQIITRAENRDIMMALYQLGVNEIVQPQLEAGLEITRLALSFLRVPTDDIKRFTDEIRHELYAPLYENDTGQ
jgi:CPA2 family monovalent cation:H+ antiporter-2